MKHYLLAIVCGVFSLSSQAQTETTVINGKTYYVYPHQEEGINRERYYKQFADRKEILQRDDKNRKVIEITYEEIEHNGKPAKKVNKRYIEELEKYPYMMYEAKNSLMKDITPALEKLPDGEYVQFYRDVPYIKDRVLRYRNDVVAGFFTVKNNQLEGVGTWYLPSGQVARKGKFVAGSKEGVWEQYSYSESYKVIQPNRASLPLDEYMASKTYDTLTTSYVFTNGIRNGEYLYKRNGAVMESGFYEDNVMVGTWKTYIYRKEKQTNAAGYHIVMTTKDLILKSQFTYNNDQAVRGKSLILREEVIPYDYKYGRYGYMEKPKYFFKDTLYPYFSGDNFPNFGSFYNFMAAKEELDLPEEEFQSFEGGEGDPYGYYGDYGYDGEGYYPPPYYDGEYYTEDKNEETFSRYDIFEYLEGKRFLLNKLIDSIGYHYMYTGVMERYHDNGQLMFRYEIENGKLKAETPVYYENGQIANEIVWRADSNFYHQKFYDFYGQLYFELRHDTLGKIIEKEKTGFDGTVVVNGRKYDVNFGEPTLDFNEREKLNKGIETKELVMEKIWKQDSTVAAQGYFDPVSRVYSYEEKTLSKKPYLIEETIFGEDYKSLTSSIRMFYNNVEMNGVVSGTYEDYWAAFAVKKDSTISPQNRVTRWRYAFKTDGDYTLLVNGNPFTGKFNGNAGGSGFSFKATDKSISYSLPSTKKDQKIFFKSMKQYEKGKITPVMDGYVPEFGGYGRITSTPMSLIYPMNEIRNNYGKGSYMLDVPFYELIEGREEFMQYGEYDFYGDYYGSNSKRSFPSSISGTYLNGKQEGLWVTKDQYGKVLRESNYMNGEMQGPVKVYSLEYPEAKPKKRRNRDYEDMYYDYEMEYDYNPIPREYRYATPKKKTYYVSELMNYKNGYIHGQAVSLNWLGDTLKSDNYVDGVQQGKSYKRNKLFYTESMYEDGYMDGVTRTWLTPADRDSVLLFELNFQNGALQGQSVAYHTNGKIAKKGFFLSGQPIDDYEAFDTLGFRYQYVKFQYNQPIEEKIWEENQLSVRYEFDWKDSIPFNTSDITQATSIDRLINRMGFDDGSMRAPYYGRPSLLDKTGITYTMTKYYPNDTVARTGKVVKGKKTGVWNYYSYQGLFLMTVNYFDTIITVNDTLKFKSKGVLTYVDAKGTPLSKSYIIEKVEKYDCAHTDHNEERMLYCFWEKDTMQHRMNGYVKNYYDNGSIQNEGYVKDGLPVGIWKMYDVDGHLSQVGTYNNGKRNGRWLSGDLGNVKNMSEICLNPNLENLEEIMSYQEKMLDVSVVYYKNGKEIRREYYGINMNSGKAPYGYDDEYYIEGF